MLHDFQLYEDREANGYPPRNHGCMPTETEFAGGFESAQEDVERRKKNAGHEPTMHMWNDALNIWNTRPIKETRKLIDRMPNIMKDIIEAERRKGIKI